MKNRDLIIGAVIGLLLGAIAGVIGVYMLDPKWGFNFWGFPTLHAAYGGAFLGFLGGMLAGLISKKYSGNKIFLLIIIPISVGCGVIGGIVYSVFVFVIQ